MRRRYRTHMHDQPQEEPRAYNAQQDDGERSGDVEASTSPFEDAGDGADDARPVDDGAAPFHIDLEAFSLTREQVAERYRAAGFDIQPRTVSDYGRRGVLRACKVPGKNGLTRYLFDAGSVEEDIARRKNDAALYAEPSTVHAPYELRNVENGAGGAGTAHAPSVDAQLREKDIAIAKLETEVAIERRERQKAEQRADREVERAMALSHRLGKSQQQLEAYQIRLKALEAPKDEQEPPAQAEGAEPRASFLQRLLGGRKGSA